MHCTHPAQTPAHPHTHTHTHTHTQPPPPQTHEGVIPHPPPPPTRTLTPLSSRHPPPPATINQRSFRHPLGQRGCTLAAPSRSVEKVPVGMCCPSTRSTKNTLMHPPCPPHAPPLSTCGFLMSCCPLMRVLWCGQGFVKRVPCFQDRMYIPSMCRALRQCALHNRFACNACPTCVAAHAQRCVGGQDEDGEGLEWCWSVDRAALH